MEDEYTPASDESDASSSLGSGTIERCPACRDLLWADAVHWCAARPVHHHDWENDPRPDLDQYGIRPEGGQWGKRGPPPGGPDAPDTRGPPSDSGSEEEGEVERESDKEDDEEGEEEDTATHDPDLDESFVLDRGQCRPD
jgi:hypothetical protein